MPTPFSMTVADSPCPPPACFHVDVRSAKSSYYVSIRMAANCGLVASSIHLIPNSLGCGASCDSSGILA